MKITKKALIPMYNPITMKINAIEIENTFSGKTQKEILEQITIYEIALALEWQKTIL